MTPVIAHPSALTGLPRTTGEGTFGFYKRQGVAENFTFISLRSYMSYIVSLFGFFPTPYSKDCYQPRQRMAPDQEEILQKYPSLRKYDENDDDYVEVCTWNLGCFHLLLFIRRTNSFQRPASRSVRMLTKYWAVWGWSRRPRPLVYPVPPFLSHTSRKANSNLGSHGRICGARGFPHQRRS